ncbi:tetratricopeptide repeat protein, partial [Nevskia soli]|uniref:tetratricopeptide repeat protein n=1 Tax=Nevskia soli TaxID=418856 RepID=UPI0015D7920D
NGEFVFDDRNLPMFLRKAATLPLRKWINVRPLLMSTYYFNFHSAGLDTFGYHAVNVIMHAANAVLLFFAVKRILEWASIEKARAMPVAIFSAAVFLLHPVQTEAVSYIASRSETLSILFFLAAFNVFLYRSRVSITFRTSLGVLLLYGCAMTSKEHTAMLPAVLLLTDYYFNPPFSLSGIRRNWRLYIPIAAAGVAGLFFFRSYINSGSNLGFGMKDLSWSQYLFTEFRAFFVYMRLLVLPYGQTVDYNFPVSHNLLERGAVFYGIALLGLIAAAFYFRKRYPIASFGFFVTLVLFAPTSSFVPIRDPLAERRLYLPFIGIALMVAEVAVRVSWRNRQAVYAALAAVCLIFAVLTFQRNQVWVGMESLWRDAVSKNPENARALMGLGDAYSLRGDCVDAIPYFERAIKIEAADYRQTANLASAYDCANQLPAALETYRKAIALRPTADAWTRIGLIQMKTNQYDQAIQSLDTASRIDSTYLPPFNYRGILYLHLQRFDAAASQFQQVLAVDPVNELALRGIDRARKHNPQF